ncbi:TetR/AcrR family transcriptional regulator [Rhodococcus sp. NPDC058514]|uniref:TetR/AcrR family transcriptional regulator n=1 Tax=unclassified Rhodococcus (in: high G+C Gram-positive bacteria) TaxID=192944 RepID=UPI003664DAAC
MSEGVADRTEGGRSAERRRELIQAAAQVFVADGYAHCGVADIVAALGVGHGTFYNYFTSKRDVLDAVVDRGFELIRERIVEDALGRSADLDEFFDRYRLIVDRLHELVRQEPELIRFVVFEAPSIDPVLIDRLLGVFGQFGDVAVGFLADGARSGALHGAVDLEVAGEAMGSILLASAVFPLHGTDTAEDLAAPLVDFLRSGLGVGT